MSVILTAAQNKGRAGRFAARTHGNVRDTAARHLQRPLGDGPDDAVRLEAVEALIATDRPLGRRAERARIERSTQVTQPRKQRLQRSYVLVARFQRQVFRRRKTETGSSKLILESRNGCFQEFHRDSDAWICENENETPTQKLLPVNGQSTQGVFSAATTKESDSGFVLITTLFDEKDPARAEEYRRCLDFNLVNQSIEAINVFFEARSASTSDLLNFLKSRNIKIIQKSQNV